MSKAILIINRPESCAECEIRFDDIYSNWCSYDNPEPNGVWIYVVEGTKPDWCPLRPLPEKIEGYNSIKHQWGEYEDGWNHCIDVILGE